MRETMNKHKFIYILLVLLMALMVLFISLEFFHAEGNFTVTVIAGSSHEEIIPWLSAAGEYYIFLPGYADISQTRICLNSDQATYIDETLLEDGMSCSAFQINVPYTVEYESGGKKYQHQITFVQSEGIATVYVETQSGDMDYIHSRKGNTESGTVSFHTAGGELAYSGKIDSINGRGNYTWMFDKKSYNLNLAEDIDLFGMGAAARWVLLSNASDSSQLRNKIVYDFSDAIGLSYSPKCEWVDLYLNGEYAGLYLLCERNEVHQERVDISGSNSFLISFELEERLISAGDIYIKTDNDQIAKIHYSENNKDFSNIKNVLQSVENAILAEDGIDPITGKSYLELIDLDSWAKKYLIEEIFGNLDACFLSQYFYYDDTGKVYAGPVWDYDLSMGNETIWQLKETDVLFANRYQVKNEIWTPWFYSLCKKQEFQERTQQLYDTVFKPCLDQLVEDTIYQYADVVCHAKEMNSLRWSLSASEKYSDEEYLVSYLQKRMDFLEAFWNDPDSYVLVQVDDGRDSNMVYFTIKYGACIPNMPDLDDTENAAFLGWYDTATNERIDFSQPVYENMEIHAKWSNRNHQVLGKLIKLVPVGVITVLFLLMLRMDNRHTRRNGWGK